MNRYYYISDSLDELESIQANLENRGIETERIHVLTEQDTEVSTHRVNEVDSLAKKDWVRYGLRGALVGLALSLTILVLALALGLMTTIWAIPILFLAAVVLGFCTWEGGLIGAHRPSRDVQLFQRELNQGNHILYVDADEQELDTIDQVIAAHPTLRRAGTGKPAPKATWRMRQSVRDLIHKLP